MFFINYSVQLFLVTFFVQVKEVKWFQQFLQPMIVDPVTLLLKNT